MTKKQVNAPPQLLADIATADEIPGILLQSGLELLFCAGVSSVVFSSLTSGGAIMKKVLSSTCALLAFATSACCYAVDAQIVGGTTFIRLDPEVLSALQLITPELPPVVSDGVDATTMEGFLGFPINSRSNGTTGAYDTDDFPNSWMGVVAHTGTIGFPAVSIEVGDFIIGLDVGRANETLSGFFAASNLDNDLKGVPLFDVPTEGLMVTPKADRFDVDADLVISAELAQALGGKVAGLEIGQVAKRAIAVPEPTLCAVVAFVLLGSMPLRRR